MKTSKRFKLVMVSIAIIALLTTGVFARLSSNTIDPIVKFAPNNKILVATGPIECTKGENLSLEVIVTQRENAAIARGKLETTCTGAIQQWEVNTKPESKFKTGTATAWALAITRDNKKITDVDQWSKEVTIVSQNQRY